MDKLKAEIGRMSLFYKIITLSFTLLFIIQFIFILWTNLTQMRFHLGYDATSYYLKAFEMWKQGTLMCDNWIDQTTLYWDSSVPIAAVLMNVFNDIFVSYGMANNLIYILIISIMVGIMNQYDISSLGKVIVLTMISCPYIGISFSNINAISYFPSTLTSGNWYGFKVMLALLFIYDYILLQKNLRNKKTIFLLCITSVLFLLSGISSGYYLGVTILLPALFCGVIQMFTDNKVKALISPQICFAYINFALIIVGKFISTNVLQFTSKDSNMVWVNIEQFWENIGSILLGYLSMLQGIQYNSSLMILDKKGITYICGLGIACITLIGFIWTSTKIVKKFEQYKQYLLPVMIVLVNVLMFTVVYTTYSGGVFEERYLIILYYMIILCMVVWIDSLDNMLIFKKFGCVILGVLLLGEIAISDYIYTTTKEDSVTMDFVKETVADFETPVVYFYGDDYAILQRNMRVYDTDKIYKLYSVNEEGLPVVVHWGDYTYYDYKDEWEDSVILCTTQDDFEQLNADFKSELTFVASKDDLYIYYSDNNILGLER